MQLDAVQKNTIEQLLKVDLQKIANQLGFTNKEPLSIDQKLLYKAVGLIDELSRLDDEEARKVVTTLSAILWDNRQENWGGLKDFLILVLNRIGLSPTAIMIDEGYDKIERKHSSLNSIFNEISVAINQFTNEVKIKDKRYLLTDFQKNIWYTIDSQRVTGISAPTSAGKSFVILLKSMQILLEKGGTIVYIVPNLSLVSQVSSDYRMQLDNFGLNEYQVINTYNANYTDTRKIFVLTQERAIAAFTQKPNPFPDLRLLVIDEIQNVEHMPSEDELRSKILYDTLIEFRYSTNAEKIIIAGPRIENIDELASNIFDQFSEKGETYHSPVVNLTYSVEKRRKTYYFKQYSDLTNDPLKEKITNYNHISGLGKSQYTDEYHQYLQSILTGLGPDSINIIFSPTHTQARKTAIAIAKQYKNTNDTKLLSLIKYIKNSVHDNYSLCDCLKKQVAYHHGRLPHHVRKVIERAVSEKLIKNIVCTTTLMQGVNLPAQNVIIRNPNLFIRRKGISPKKLTNYELANLRGRAGRLLKDFIGRTIILDEGSFEMEEQQTTLFEDTTKELKATYKDRFQEYKDEVVASLINEDLTETEKPYSFLLPYIRQTVLRFGDKSKERLNAVGINISDDELDKVVNSMKKLKVPQNICISNRYWDPIALDKLYRIRQKPNIPSSANDKNIAIRLKEALLFMKEHFPYYYKKYLNIEEVDGVDMLLSICINAEKWLKETSLKTILSTSYYDDEDKIENTINHLQNTISYRIPSLLKPLYDIIHPGNMFLNFIEMGAYKPITRKIIELGVPRETAIRITSLIEEIPDTNDEKWIRSAIEKISGRLNFWERIQLDSIIKITH